MIKRSPASFVAGFLTAALLFGGTAMAVDYYQEQITVDYVPLKYYVDGVQKAPPEDQKGFIFGGRTYVPLRFIGEALGKKVGYDGETTSIYIGARPGPVPALWEEFEHRGDAAFKLTYFEEGVQTVRGTPMPNTVMISAMTMRPVRPDQLHIPSEMWVDYVIPSGATTLTGTVFVPLLYFGHEGEGKIGRLSVLNEQNQVIYNTDDLRMNSSEVAFSVPGITGQRVRLVFTLYPNQGLPVSDSVLAAQLGISDLKAH